MDVALAHIAANEAAWKNPKHRQQWANTLETYVYPMIGDVPVGDVDTHHILSILEPIWLTKSETANRVRGRMETVLDAAKARNLRTGDNPARWKGHLALILPPRAKLSRGHHKALPYQDLPAFMAQMKTKEGMSVLALEFTILTAARTNEVLGANWEEIDREAGLWIIPAERMKAVMPHRIPLTPRLLEILDTLKPLGAHWLFPSASGKPLSTMAMATLLRRMDVDVTVHGFRSSFRDWVAEQTHHPHEVAEMALAHTIDNKVEQAYHGPTLAADAIRRCRRSFDIEAAVGRRRTEWLKTLWVIKCAANKTIRHRKPKNPVANLLVRSTCGFRLMLIV